MRTNKALFNKLIGVSLLAAASVLLATAAPGASADDFNLIDQKAQISLGTFLNNSKLKIRVDGEAGSIGTDIDWGNSFGDSEKSRFRLDGVWRFSPRHHMRFMYTDYNRAKTTTLQQDIEWGDDLILAGSSAKGTLAFSIIEAAYEYAFRTRDDLELCLTAGLHYTTFEAKLLADVQTPGGGVGGTLGGKASVDVPLPVFGGRAMWRLGRSFYLDAQAQWFALSIDEYDGSILNYRANIMWQPKKSIGIGIGYDSFKVDAKVKKTSFTGKMNWTYEGPQIFYNVAF